ncbi:MAG: S-layer homology domain-containing protein [Saccharofermentans sp.]|nr:S-layer homology domain-containing protein [Saccharofermentans sp.]
MKSIKSVCAAFSVIFLSLIFAFGIIPAGNVSAAAVTIDEQVFKDAKFREYVKTFDENGDGKLSDAEIKKVTKIELVNKGVNSLDGIEVFTYLKTFICNYNYLRSIDLSKNTNLETIECLKLNLESLDLSNNKNVKSLKVVNFGFTFVDFHNSPALRKAFDKGTTTKGEDIQYGKYIDYNYNSGEAFLRIRDGARCGMFIKEKDFPDSEFRRYLKRDVTDGKDYISFDMLDNLAAIDVSSEGITSLKGIEYFTGLRSLNCSNNALKSLDISKNTLLNTLNCGNNQLTKLDVSKNPKLTILVCFNNKISKLDISKNPGLKKLYCEENPIDQLNLSYHPNFVFLVENTTPTKGTLQNGEKYLIYFDTIDGEEYYLSFSEKTKVRVEKERVTLNKTSANLVCGNTLTLTATVDVAGLSVSWSSSDTSIATVDNTGKVKGKKAGKVTISAKAGRAEAICEVQVLYKDVTDSSKFWFKPTNYLTNTGVVKGYDNQTLFKPANECTRAQMLTFLWRLAGSPAPRSSTCTFSDVSSSDYFYKPVIWAVEKGITTGYSGGLFKPRNVCSRAQTVTFLWRMAGKPAPSSTRSSFIDVESSAYYYKATIWASEMNILAGYADNTFRPEEKCLRRQMVTFLYKYDKYVNGRG